MKLPMQRERGPGQRAAGRDDVEADRFGGGFGDGARRRDRDRAPLSRTGINIPGKIVALFDAAAASHLRVCMFLVLLCLLAVLPGFFAVPPVDRDEARFAQISRQMSETGDLTEMRVGIEARHTRPPALHWIQAGIVSAAEAVGIEGARREIAFYRLPSLIGGIGAVLLTYWAALAFTRRRAALFAATLLTGSVAFGVAAHVALPDVFLIAAVAAMMGALGRLYLHPSEGEGTDRAIAAMLWLPLALALPISGIVTPFYVALPVVTLIAIDRSARFLKAGAPLLGLALCLAVAALWFVLRHGIAGASAPPPGLLTGRVAPSFPGFSGLPGAYLLMFWVMFWPAAPLAALAVPIVWQTRRLPEVRFLLAWIIPAWLLCEMLPAKVPVYVLPTFPAIAILIALAMERGALPLANTRLVRILWLWPVMGALIAVLTLLGLAIFDRTTSFLAWPLLLAGFFALVTAAVSVRDYGVEKATLLAIAGTLVAGIGVMQLILPQMKSVWVSPRLVEIAMQERCAAGGGAMHIATAGYREPSLLFLSPQPVRFLDGPRAADFLVEDGCRVALVERRQEVGFVLRAEALGLRIERGADAAGYDYAAGRRVNFSAYRKAGN